MSTMRFPTLPCCQYDFKAQGEQRLPELCEIQHAILENAGHAIIATDITGTVLYFNQAAQDMLGYSWQEVVGRHTPELFHLKEEVEQRAQDLTWQGHSGIDPGFAVFVSSLAQARREEREWTYVRKDGSHLPVTLSVTTLRDAQGDPIGYLGIANDITERRRMEQELRIAATAFESQAAILITDSSLRILRVNPAFTHLTGYAAEEAIGQSPSLLKSGRHDPTFYRQMWTSLNEHGHWQGEIWNRRKNGEIYPEWLTINVVRDDRGQPTHYVSTFSDITDLKVAESEIHNLAFYDPLTGLPNRRLFLNRLGQARAASNRSRLFGALLLIDLDNFKTLNDTQGHDVGDRLLVEVANRLSACIREGETAARPGGDEFVVMLENLGADESSAAIRAEVVAEKIAETLGRTYRLGQNNDYYGTASIGVSLFRGHEKTGDALLKHADIALYKAKDAGRNCVRFFDAAMQTALEERSRMEHGLRHALTRNEFRLHVQPQVCAERGIIGAETLIRWQPPEGPMVPPADFIPLAEETGLIQAIGEWVLNESCAHLARWATQPRLRDLYLAVNVSPRQFRQPDFVAQVRRALDRHQVAPQRLKLELTESLLLDNVEATVAKMNELRELGVRFSLDDFGTGYASLAYLKRFPFNQLKVDRSFVRDIESDPDDAALVRAIIAMGDTLHLEVIAEGVETEAQRNYLLAHGCRTFQGYLYGRPVPFQEFAASLAMGADEEANSGVGTTG